MIEVLDASNKILDIELPCEVSDEEVLCDECPFNILIFGGCALDKIHERAKKIIEDLDQNASS